MNVQRIQITGLSGPQGATGPVGCPGSKGLDGMTL